MFIQCLQYSAGAVSIHEPYISILGECEVTQSCPTLCDPMNCNQPGSSVLGNFQARVLEWVSISFSRGSSLTQGLNLGLPYCRQMLYHLSHHGSPSNEYSGLISYRVDWFDLLAVQGTLESLLQHNSKGSILQQSAFFIVQLLHLYMTRKTIALTIQTSKRCLCSLISCLGLSQLFFQGASVF